MKVKTEKSVNEVEMPKTVAVAHSFRNVCLQQPIPARHTPLQGQMPYIRRPLVEAVREEPEPVTSAPTHLHFADLSPRPQGIQFRHPVHLKWAAADFERVWRFDELMNNNGPRDVVRDGDDWSHPAHSESTLLPASETADLWHMEIPPPVPKEPQRLSFGSTRADVRANIELSRNYVERLRNDYEQSKTVNQQAGAEPVWTFELQERWNEDLKVLGMPEEPVYVVTKGFAVKKWESDEAYARAIEHEEDLAERRRLEEEKYAYQSATSEDSADRNQRTDYDDAVWSDDESGDSGFDRAGDHITNDGMRETRGDRPNDHQERKHWFPFFRAILNEEGWTAVEYEWGPEGFTAVGGRTPEHEAEIRNHPRFPELVALYQVLFSGRSIDELGIDKDPNTAAKWLARAKEIRNPLDRIPESERQRAIGHYVCTIVLNNRAMLKVLAPLDAPIADAVAAFNNERQQARRKAIDNAKQDAKAKGLGKKAAKAFIAERVKRIDKAYDGVLIMAHRGITFNELDYVTPADVIFSNIK
jgi:hypothetical protein